jgi:hypothetical protein
LFGGVRRSVSEEAVAELVVVHEHGQVVLAEERRARRRAAVDRERPGR